MTVKFLPHTANYGALYTVAATESHSVYPITNIKHQRLSKVWRTITDLTAVDITIDLGVARDVNIVGLVNHNFSAGVTLAIAAGTTSAVSNFSDTITYRAGAAYKVLSATQTYRYWRIRITDSGNTDGFLEAGYLLLGLLESPPKEIAFSPGLQIEHISDVNTVTSEGGAFFADHITDLKRITVNFRNLERAEREDLLSFGQALREETNPLFLIPDDAEYDGWYVRLITSIQEQTSMYSSFNALTFQEEPGGKIMAA